MATSKNKKEFRAEDNESTSSSAQSNSEENNRTKGAEGKKSSTASKSLETAGKKQSNLSHSDDQNNGSSGKSGTEQSDNSRTWSSGNGGNGSQEHGSGRGSQQFQSQEQEPEYSRNWDTLKNDQYGQMTQGSYNPRNNPGFSDDRGDRNYRSNRSMYEERRGGERGRRGDEGERGGDRYQEWGSPRGYDRENDRDYGDSQRDQRSQGSGYQGHDAPRNRYNDNNYGTRQYDPSERYGSHWRMGGDQELHRNQGGQYSDYENPPFDRDEYRGHSPNENRSRSSYGRQYDNFGSEFDNPYEGSRMRDQDYGRQSARERGWDRGYQYGNDAYNSGSSQDNPRGYRPYGDENESRSRDNRSYRGSDSYDSSRNDGRNYRGDRDERSREERRYRSDRGRNRR